MNDEAFNDADLEIPEITDFSGAVPNPFFEAYQAWKMRQVTIDGDLIGEFPDAKAVNDALRTVKRERAGTGPKKPTRTVAKR